MNGADILELPVLDPFHLFGGQKTHRGGVFEYDLICRFAAVYEVGVHEFRDVAVVEDYVTALYVTMAGTILGQKIQNAHNCSENPDNFPLADTLISQTVFLDEVLQRSCMVGILQVHFYFRLLSTTKSVA